MTRSNAPFWHVVRPQELEALDALLNRSDDVTEAGTDLLREMVERLKAERDEQSEPDMRMARSIIQQDEWSNDDVEVDENATVCRADDGYWVQAWAWVDEVEVGEELEACGGQ